MTFNRVFKISSLPRLLAAAVLLGAASLTSCRSLEGDNLGATGAVEVLVQDQNATPIFDVSVFLHRVNDVIVQRTANNGVARFDLVEAGERTFYVQAPSGYSGGGPGNSKPVSVEVGKVTKTTFTITKDP